jgi:hypothetical protein
MRHKCLTLEIDVSGRKNTTDDGEGVRKGSVRHLRLRPPASTACSYMRVSYIMAASRLLGEPQEVNNVRGTHYLVLWLPTGGERHRSQGERKARMRPLGCVTVFSFQAFCFDNLCYAFQYRELYLAHTLMYSTS